MTSDLRAALEQTFGHVAFRGRQEEVVRHFLEGGNALVVMATGEGKSICYQLPALVSPGLTVVVSPLIALMDDQVAGLRKKGIAATCVHSLLERHERERRLAEVEDGRIRILYCTPERFRVPGFSPWIQRLSVARLAVDEAHCVSHWGHDFRPDYLQLGEVRRSLGDPPVLALTATATPDVQADIRRVLRIEDAPLFHTGIERENLLLAVRHVHGEEQKQERLVELLARTGGPAVVYFALIQDLVRVESFLQRRGLAPLVYHGDLSAHERRSQQAAFEAKSDALMLATNAFGMGIDKPDVRAIVHWQVPRTLEAYYQEIGRAGRDGLGSCCELLWDEQDLQIQRAFVEWANPDADLLVAVAAHLAGLGDRIHALDRDDLVGVFFGKNRRDGRVDTCLRLLRTAGCVRGELGRDLEFVRMPERREAEAWLPSDKRTHDLEGLLAMVRYASEPACRKATIHAHFGFASAVPCGSCDVCTDAETWIEQRMPSSRKPLAAVDGETVDDLPVRRGDWIEIEGMGLCCIRRVHVVKGRLRVDVERAADLQERSIDLDRRRWRRVES